MTAIECASQGSGWPAAVAAAVCMLVVGFVTVCLVFGPPWWKR